MTKHKPKEKEQKTEDKTKPKPTDKERIVELTTLLQRLQAEFQNYQRRTAEERTNFTSAAKSSILGKLIPIIDHFELALQHECTDKNYEIGMKMIHGLFIDMLTSENVSIINPVDEVFNPNTHEAISTAYIPEKEENIILEVTQKGYILSGKVLRSAKVIINRKPVEEKLELKNNGEK